MPVRMPNTTTETVCLKFIMVCPM